MPRKPFVEALPRFNILTLDKQFRQGLDALVWTDQDDRIVGMASFTLSDFGCMMSYKLRRLPDIPQHFNDAGFELTRSSPGTADWRPAVRCGSCEKPKNSMIFYNRHWACRSCHGINHRSTRIDADTLRYTHFLELRKIAENPRPRYMRHDKYDAIVNKYLRESREWDHRAPRTLNAELSAEIRERYVAAADLPDWRTTLMPDQSGVWTIRLNL